MDTAVVCVLGDVDDSGAAVTVAVECVAADDAAVAVNKNMFLLKRVHVKRVQQKHKHDERVCTSLEMFGIFLPLLTFPQYHKMCTVMSLLHEN